jgi:hypothetical protein
MTGACHHTWLFVVVVEMGHLANFSPRLVSN